MRLKRKTLYTLLIPTPIRDNYYQEYLYRIYHLNQYFHSISISKKYLFKPGDLCKLSNPNGHCCVSFTQGCALLLHTHARPSKRKNLANINVCIIHNWQRRQTLLGDDRKMGEPVDNGQVKPLDADPANLRLVFRENCPFLAAVYHARQLDQGNAYMPHNTHYRQLNTCIYLSIQSLMHQSKVSAT